MLGVYVVEWATKDVDRFLAHSAGFRNVEDAEAAASLLTRMNAKDVRVRKAGKQVRFSVNSTGEIVMARAG